MSQFKAQRGFLTIAQNSNDTDYLTLAYLQAMSIKLTMPQSLYAVLVDEYTNEQLLKMKQFNVPEKIVDGKKLLIAAVNNQFEKINDTNVYTYYHLVLEHDGNKDQRYGIYANGILSETTSENDFLKKMI